MYYNSVRRPLSSNLSRSRKPSVTSANEGVDESTNGDNGVRRRFSAIVNHQIHHFTDFLTERDQIDLNIHEKTQEDIEHNRRFIGSTFLETVRINRPWMQKVLRFFMFYTIGIVVYGKLEDWTFRDSVYFITQTISTLGYGNISPHSSAARLFSIFYIFVGILLTFSVIGDVASTIVVRMRDNYGNQKLKRMNRLQVVVRSVLNCLMWIVILFLVNIIGAAVFSLNEGWSFLDALYFATYTSTSVGYGDLTLTKTSSVWFNIFYILIAIAITAVAFEKISSFTRHLDEAELKQVLDAIEPSKMLIDAIGKGSGKQEISQSEYILHMLQLSGKIDPRDLDPWIEKFKEFDLDRDGILSMKDIHSYEQMLKRGQLKKAKLYRPHRQRSIVEQITTETKDVLLETLKLKKSADVEESNKPVSIELSSNPAVSPIQQARILRRASDLNRQTITENAKNFVIEENEEEGHKSQKRQKNRGGPVQQETTRTTLSSGSTRIQRDDSRFQQNEV
jgi:potassium channel subfamily K